MGAAGFRDALKGVGLALASAEHGQRALERSLSSWSKCAGTVAPPALKDKLASTLKHGALPVLVAAKHGDVDGLRACLQQPQLVPLLLLVYELYYYLDYKFHTLLMPNVLVYYALLFHD